MYVCMYVCVYVCMYVCVYVCIYAGALKGMALLYTQGVYSGRSRGGSKGARDSPFASLK